MSAEKPKPDRIHVGLADVIGANAHRLRSQAGLTLDQVSIAARRRGLRWSESRVADFEAGRVAPNLGTLAAYCIALSDLGCSEATLPRLVEYSTPVQINDELLLWEFDLVNLMSGRPVEEPKPVETQPEDEESFTLIDTPFERSVAWRVTSRYGLHFPTLGAVKKASGATEERLRKSLGSSSMLLAHLSAALWKQTFSQERDMRAGAGANAQKRGQVSRQMRAELQAAIRAATHGDDQ